MSATAKTISTEKVWMKYYSDEAKRAEMPGCKAWDYVLACNSDRMDEPALHYYGANITYRELKTRVNAVAAAFTAAGVRSGDVVSFVSAAIPETVSAVYALNKIGAAANTIDPRMDVASIGDRICESGSRITVCLGLAWPKMERLLGRIGQELVIVQDHTASLPPLKRGLKRLADRVRMPKAEGVIGWKEFVRRGRGTSAPEAPYVGDALVAITYTGGTTGFPKGVMMTNDSMNTVALSFRHSAVYRNDGDRFLGIIPIFAAYGMVCGMHMPLCMRMTLVPVPRFIPGEIGKLVRNFRPQHIISTPVFIELLIGSREVKNMDLSFLYTLASGGDSMNEGLEHKLDEFRQQHNMRFPLAQGYGMSELSAAATFCVNNVYKPGSVGIPSLTVNVGIFDPESGEELGYNRTGEVCVTGSSMMKGYFNAPEETAHVMRRHADGQVWIHSGDLGYMDEDGFLYIVGRIKRMITRFDGHKVFPINLEGFIADRPDVHNCAVIGVRDMDHSQGHYPLALVEPMPGVDAQPLCEEIFALCDAQVEERGRPVAILPLEKIPLTPMGKIDYRALEKEYASFDYTAWAAKLQK